MRILLIGAFSFNKLDVGGQPVKSRELYNSLIEKYGNKAVRYIETIGWRKRKIRLFFSIVFGVLKSDLVVMLPAQNGVSVFSNLLVHLKRIKKRIRLYYDVVGGWLPDLLKNNDKLRSSLKAFDGIWVETESMKMALLNFGINKVTVIPNFRNEQVQQSLSLRFKDECPHRLCIFSRVMREKGVDIAIEAVVSLNKEYGEMFLLDIYGPIDEAYRDLFFESTDQSSGWVHYCGTKKTEESKNVLSNYFALLFPTHYAGEGMAGTLVDALFAGCPIIASDWKYNKEIVDENVGTLFSPVSVDSLKTTLLRIGCNPTQWNKKRINCLQEATKYTRETNIEKIYFELENEHDNS